MIARFGTDGMVETERTICKKFNEHNEINVLAGKKVALENYIEGAQNILRYAWPPLCSLVIGDENAGVSSATISSSDDTVYIPQQGTISSLNVVTALAIALHCLHISHNVSRSRLIIGNTSATQNFMCDDFAEKRPERNGDLRPVRPSLYQRPNTDVLKYAKKNRLGNFSIYYENTIDFRTLGGSIRNANAFGIKTVYYSGKRKINRQGAVGSYFFVDSVFLDDATIIEDILKKHEILVLLPTYTPSQNFSLLDNDVRKDAWDKAQLPCIFLDDTQTLLSYLANRRSEKDILLVLCQENLYPSETLIPHARFIVQIVSDKYKEQIFAKGRGLPACVAGAIAMFHISHALRGCLGGINA